MELPPSPDDYGGNQDPLQNVVPEGIRSKQGQRHDGQGERRCCPEALPLPALVVAIVVDHVAGLVRVGSLVQLVSDLLDGGYENRRIGVRIDANESRSPGKVHRCRFNTLLAVQDALDSDRACGTGHPVDVEKDGVGIDGL